MAAGRVLTARASWWGFDRRDSTAALQAAFDSRAQKVIIDKMPGPWIVTTLRLPSDKEIVCEQGVIVEAKRGAFLGKGDCLLLANGCKRLTIAGNGAVFRMHKDDYHKPPYELAEWRHALSLRGCEDVTITDLTLADSGGDGIYLGTGNRRATNRNIVIRNVVCDGNNRQGISVITADNLLIENCRLVNTRGTAPEAGIDFEPNHPEETLSNCVMRNCSSDNNAGHAYHFYLGNLHEQSPPISIRMENCTSKGCQRHSASVAIDNRNGAKSVRGSIEFVNCRFDQDLGGGIQVRGNEADGCRIRFARCELIRDDRERPGPAPITIQAPRRPDLTIGNIEFAQCVIRDTRARRPIELAVSPLAGLDKVTGSLTVHSPEGERQLTLDSAQLQRWFPDQGRIGSIPRWDFDWRNCQPVSAHALDARTARILPVAATRVTGGLGRRRRAGGTGSGHRASGTVRNRGRGRGMHRSRRQETDTTATDHWQGDRLPLYSTAEGSSSL